MVCRHLNSDGCKLRFGPRDFESPTSSGMLFGVNMQTSFSIRSMTLALALCVSAFAAKAAELPFNKAGFETALAQGKPVIVDFSATWCPTCKEQKPIVQGLLKEPKLRPVTFFVADFDTETALKKQLGITMQSTFVVFKGGKEVGRATGQTQKQEIQDLFDKAL
jgi:thioredoxin 1